MSNLFTKALASLLIVTLVAPATFFIAPNRASASAGSCLGGLLGLATAASTIASVPVQNKPVEGATGSTAGSTAASCVYDLIIVPLARAAIRAILQKLTASVISWINGGNGSGQSSYVRNTSAHLQSVGDAAALFFIGQMVTGFNSPFGPTISSSVYAKYGQQTSLAGFYAANQCTLARSSPNINAFLAGNWSQGGGVSAWLALTTKSENNPYMLYQSALSQVDRNVSQAQTNRRQDMIQGNGFISFCGQSTSTTLPNGSVRTNAPCTTSNGTPGSTQTPGSVIAAYANKALGSGFDQLVAAQDLDAALGAIASALLNKVLGSVSGLFGSSSGEDSIVRSLNEYSASSVDANQTAYQTAQDIYSRAEAYVIAWKSIEAAANNASASVTDLASYCTEQSALAQQTINSGSITDSEYLAAMTKFVADSSALASSSPSVIKTKIDPIFSQAQAAFVTAETTQAFAVQVQNTAASGKAGNSGSLATDVPTLMGMQPSLAELSNAQSNATVDTSAKASPAGSLNVSGGTLASQMSLISKNASELKTTVCTIPVQSSSSSYGN